MRILSYKASTNTNYASQFLRSLCDFSKFTSVRNASSRSKKLKNKHAYMNLTGISNNIKIIDKTKHPLVQSARDLASPSKRITHTVLEDMMAIHWSTGTAIKINHFFLSNKALEIPEIECYIKSNPGKYYHVSDAVLRAIIKNKYISPMIAVADHSYLNKEPNASIAVVFDNLQDQGNIGSIIRTSAAFGINNIVASEKSFDFFSKKTITTSRGLIFQSRYYRYCDPKETVFRLKKAGYILLGTSSHGEDINKIKPKIKDCKTALMIGNETNGLCDELLDMSDFIVKIPMENTVESLNVSVASGILLYELTKK